MLVNKYGFDFDGNTVISLYNNPTISSTNFSLYFELLPSDEDSLYTNLFNGRYGSGGNGGMSIIYPYGSQTQFTFAVNDSNGNTTNITNNSVSSGSLLKMLIVSDIDESDGEVILKMYINGNLTKVNDSTVINTSNIKLMDTTRNNTPFGGFYNGSISSASKSTLANFTVFNEALTDQECIDITNGNFNNTDSRIVFYESFNNTTKGSIIGTEQYAIVGTEHINGELFERKETESFASTDYYKWDITDWVYGGSFTIDVNVTGNKTIKTWLFYDEDDKAYVYNSQTTTDQQITVDLPDTEARSMIIEVISDNDFTSITYTFEHIAPIVVYDESVSVGVSTYDTTVNYANNQTLSDSVSVRINKEDSNLFKTIVENNLYFMDKERAVLNYNFSELDTTRYMFDLSLTRLL